MSEQSLQLSHQEPLAGLLLAAGLVTDDLAQVGNGLGIALAVDVVVGIGVVPVLDGTPVHGVAALLGDDVLGIVDPPQLRVALGQPGTGTPQDGGLRLV